MTWGNFLVAVQVAAGPAGSDDQLRSQRQRGLVGTTSVAPNGAMPDGGEDAFDGVGGPDVLPPVRREVLERE